MPPANGNWRVLEPLELAVLDRRFEAIAARLPGVMSELIRRQGRQAKALATQRALMQVAGLANRLLLTIWCLAERWGRVSPHGRLVPPRLTHAVLADLVGARRPPVTLALRQLVDARSPLARAERRLDCHRPRTGRLARVTGRDNPRRLRWALAEKALWLFVASLAPLTAAVDSAPIG
jgi:hypothetical protein